MRSVSGSARCVWSYPLARFGHVQNFEPTPPEIFFFGGRTFLVRKYAVCPVLMRQASCRYPVCIRRCPLDLICGTVNLRTCNGLNGRVTHAKQWFMRSKQ